MLTNIDFLLIFSPPHYMPKWNHVYFLFTPYNVACFFGCHSHGVCLCLRVCIGVQFFFTPITTPKKMSCRLPCYKETDRWTTRAKAAFNGITKRFSTILNMWKMSISWVFFFLFLLLRHTQCIMSSFFLQTSIEAAVKIYAGDWMGATWMLWI